MSAITEVPDTNARAAHLQLDALPLVLTPRDVQAVLPLGRNAVYELLSSGRLRSVRVGQKFLIPLDALREFLGSDGERGGTGIP